VPHGTLQTLPTRKGESQGRPPSNRCIIFKRTFETKFGQELLKIRRFWGRGAPNYPAKLPRGCRPAQRRAGLALRKACPACRRARPSLHRWRFSP
jgi:hypothetical protein